MRWNQLELIQTTITWVCWVHDLAYFPNGKSTFDRFPWRFDLRKPKTGRLLQIAMTHGSYLPDFKRDCWWFINVKPMNTRMIWLGWLNSWVSASNLRVSWSTRRRSMLRCEADDFFFAPKLERAYWMFFFFVGLVKINYETASFPVNNATLGYPVIPLFWTDPDPLEQIQQTTSVWSYQSAFQMIHNSGGLAWVKSVARWNFRFNSSLASLLWFFG